MQSRQRRTGAASGWAGENRPQAPPICVARHQVVEMLRMGKGQRANYPPFWAVPPGVRHMIRLHGNNLMHAPLFRHFPVWIASVGPRTPGWTLTLT